MKTIRLIFITSLILSGIQLLNAQSVEKILETHFKIMGQEKLLGVQNIITKGILRQSGVEIEIITYNKRPHKYRLEGRYANFVFTEVYTGESGWIYNQMLGDKEPKVISEKDIETLKERADIDGLLYNYKEKGYTIELLEPESVGNTLTDVLHLTKQNGTSTDYYIDSETGIIVKEASKSLIGGKEMEYEILYGNYRYVDQILFPFSVDVYTGGELTMEYDFVSIELDKEIEDYRFETPQSLREQIETDNY